MTSKLAIPDESIISKIYLIRGQKVMVDQDLSELYDVETKQLKRQVRRNITRFPEDFMFELDRDEFENLRSQTGTSRWGGSRYTPMAFTEQGVTMLSCILNSERAIEVNIRLIRIFARMREMLLTHKDILLKLEQLEKKISGHDNDIDLIFSAIKQLIHDPNPPRKRIGFKVKDDE